MPKTYSIVGTDHRKSDQFLREQPIGAPAVLVREPTNRFDPNAIQVWVGGKFVGYIPKKQNAVLAQFIDQQGGNSAITMQMAMDEAIAAVAPNIKAIEARFLRSPNSAFPQVEVP